MFGWEAHAPTRARFGAPAETQKPATASFRYVKQVRDRKGAFAP